MVCQETDFYLIFKELTFACSFFCSSLLAPSCEFAQYNV